MGINRSERVAKERYLMQYTLLFIAVATVSFLYFIFLRTTFVYRDDAVYQHYPLLVNLRHMVGAFLRGEGFSFWSENIGLGSDTLGNMAIVLMDPFNYIAAAFPVEYIDVGYSVAVLLRMYAAGLAMIAFLKYHKLRKKVCVIGGISYAFCHWAIAVMRHGFFLLPLILLPLVILGIDKVFDGKRPYVLIFSVWASLVTYLYFAYMTAIFSFIYICLRYWVGQVEGEKSIKDFFIWIGKFVGWVLIACCLAAPVIFSTLYSLVNAVKSTGVDVKPFISLKDAIRAIPSLIDGTEVTGNYSFTAVNALIALMLPIMPFRLRKKENRVILILEFFCLIMTLVPYWGSLMNGFSYSAGRWCYILAFFSVWAGGVCLDQIQQFSIKEKKAIVLWIIILGLTLTIAGIFTNVISSASLVMGLCTVTFMGLLTLNFSKIISKYAYIFLAVSIGTIYIIKFSPFEGNDISKYTEIGEANEIYQKSLLRAESKIKDKDFWRMDYIEHLNVQGEISQVLSTPLNESLYWGGRTLTTYLSSIDEDLLSYNKMLGNNGGYFRRVCVVSNDNRSRLNFLHGVKYYLRNKENENVAVYAGYGYKKYKDTQDAVILKSRQDAGLGYVFPTVMKETDFEKYDALDKEQILMQTAVISDVDSEKLNLSMVEKEQLLMETEEIPYTVSEMSELGADNEFQVERAGKKLEISIPRCKNVELYVEFKNLVKKPYSVAELKKINGIDEETSSYNKMKFNMGYMSYAPYKDFEYFVQKDNIEKRISYRDGDNQGLTDQDMFLVNLGYFDEVEGDISITFNTLGKYSYDSLKVYAVSQDNFDDQAQKLVDNRFQMTSQSANKITGTVSAQQDGMLYLSILYHPGWEIYVDGKKTDTYRTDICFTGVPVKQGAHTVELVYRPVGFELSLMLFAMGVMAVISIVFYYKKKEKK